MPKVIKKRISKKPEIETEEQVKERIDSLRDKLAERQRTLIKYGALVLVVVIAVAGFFIYNQTTNQKAKSLEFQAYKLYSGPVAPGSNRQENMAKALDMFKKAYDINKSPSSLYYSSVCYYDLGRYDEAVKTLKDFTGKYSNDPIYTPLAYQKLASAYIAKADLNEARKALDALYNLKGNLYKDFALMQTAMLLEKEGKIDEANRQYEELTKKYPDSPFKAEALAKLSAKKQG